MRYQSFWQRRYVYGSVGSYHLICFAGEGNKAFHELCKELGRDDLKAERKWHNEKAKLESWTVRVPA